MTISNILWSTSSLARLALTPIERWAAARRMSPNFISEYWSILAAIAVLLVLVLLLWWVTASRRRQDVDTPQQWFDQCATQRGLGARERQVLSAIAERSDLKQSHDIFTMADAFEQGAARLLAECTRSRAPHEYERLADDVDRLRQKLGHDQADRAGRPADERPPCVEMAVPAVVARLPFMRIISASEADISTETAYGQRPEPVRAVVTQIDGPRLRLDTWLHVEAGDRIVVLFKLPQVVAEAKRWCIVEHIARVIQCHDGENSRSIDTELIGLSHAELDELARLVEAIRSGTNDKAATDGLPLAVGASATEGQ